MAGNPNTTRTYIIRQCCRWDDDGTHYTITFGELIEQPFRLVKRITITQNDIIDFGKIPKRIERILPLAARSLEIWESTRGQESRNWKVYPTSEVKSGLTQVVLTLIYSIHDKRSQSSRLNLSNVID